MLCSHFIDSFDLWTGAGRKSAIDAPQWGRRQQALKEICEKAGVNRSTFYLHYETIGDLLEESLQHIIDQFVGFMPYDTVEFLKKLQGRPLEELYLITPEYLTPYLTYIKGNRRIFRTALERAATLRMSDAYNSLNQYVFTPILNRFCVPDANRKYIMAFYISGLMAIVKEWLRDDLFYALCLGADRKLAVDADAEEQPAAGLGRAALPPPAGNG